MIKRLGAAPGGLYEVLSLHDLAPLKAAELRELLLVQHRLDPGLYPVVTGLEFLPPQSGAPFTGLDFCRGRAQAGSFFAEDLDHLFPLFTKERQAGAGQAPGKFIYILGRIDQPRLALGPTSWRGDGEVNQSRQEEKAQQMHRQPSPDQLWPSGKQPDPAESAQQVWPRCGQLGPQRQRW